MKIKATNVKLIIEIEKKSTLKTYKLSNAGFDTNSCCFGLMRNTVEENFASLLLPRDLNIHEKKYKLLTDNMQTQFIKTSIK